MGDLVCPSPCTDPAHVHRPGPVIRCDACGHYRDTPTHELGCWTVLRDAISRVRALHQEVDHTMHGPVCRECRGYDFWPCPTVVALDGEPIVRHGRPL